MGHKPGFPSGQRGWTQDPLRKASQVRILPPALSSLNVTLRWIIFNNEGPFTRFFFRNKDCQLTCFSDSQGRFDPHCPYDTPACAGFKD